LSPAPEAESADDKNGKADPGHGSSKHDKLNSELAQLRLELDELRKSQDSAAAPTIGKDKK
jgi:hypothetical protein